MEGTDARPKSIQPVVMVDSEGGWDIANMRWGFKLPDRLLFNTRSDTASTSNFWKRSWLNSGASFRHHPIFEWQDKKGSKTKYEVVVPRRKYFSMAWVWAPWKNPKTEKWEGTFSIFTSDPSGVMVKIHDRQRVILAPRDYEEWLTPTERPFPSICLRSSQTRK